MKTRKSNGNGNGKTSAQELILKAATTQKIADAARKHLKMLKAEHKQARKAFKQAKKAAKRARKEAKAATKLLKGRNGTTRHPQKAKVVHKRSTHVPARTTARTRAPGISIPLPAASAVPTSVSAATA